VNGKRLYGTVAACAVVCYLGVLWNRFAWDDTFIIVHNELVKAGSGWWRAFAQPYWPPEIGGGMYRPLTLATYVLDWSLGGPALFHAVNVLWHAAAALLVAHLVHRWAGEAAALTAGVVFAVHPVHVEAVANVVGRAELMATTFTLLAVYAAVERQSVVASTLCWILGLLSKETAVVAPALIAAVWVLDPARPAPPPRRLALFVGCWIAAGVAYAFVRALVLSPYPGTLATAPVFWGQSPVAVRLTAVAALADVARLLVFPLTLRADYSPNERTIVSAALDGRLWAGVACLTAWGLLLWLAWRRGRAMEAVGLAWIALAYALVANLLFPIGVLIAERTLYLPSAGLAVAAGGLARGWSGRRLALLVAAVALGGGGLTAARVPVWRSDFRVTLSVLEDSPASYLGPMRMAAVYLEEGRAREALDAARLAASICPVVPRPFVLGAHAALKLRRPALADSLLERADRLCVPCRGLYEAHIAAARLAGDTAVADHLAAHLRRLNRL
jgi:hypothetical protein